MNFFDNLLGALQVGGTLVFSPVIRNWYNRWGATDDEVNRTLPGDELVPAPLLGYTHALTIHAPAAASGPGWPRWDRVAAGCTVTMAWKIWRAAKSTAWNT